MNWRRITNGIFPTERSGVRNLAVVAPHGVDELVHLAGAICPQCGVEFTACDVVIMVNVDGGHAFIHDADIEREAVA